MDCKVAVNHNDSDNYVENGDDDDDDDGKMTFGEGSASGP